MNPLPSIATINDPYGSFIVAGFRLKDFPRSRNLLSVGQESSVCAQLVFRPGKLCPRARTGAQLICHQDLFRSFNEQKPDLRFLHVNADAASPSLIRREQGNSRVTLTIQGFLFACEYLVGDEFGFFVARFRSENRRRIRRLPWYQARQIKVGARGGSRTHNLRLRRPSLYPVELRAHPDGECGKTRRVAARPQGRTAKPSFVWGRHWDPELTSSGGTARQRPGLRENGTTDWDVRLRAASSAAFPGMHRMGRRQGTGKSELQLVP